MIYQNNFHIIRFILACLIIISHSYSLVDPYFDINYTGHAAFKTLTSLKVYGFFVISGYLIYFSLEKTKSITQFLSARLIRILPLYILIILITTILCGFYFNGTYIQYLTQSNTWSYLFNNISIVGLKHTINGVFSTNPLPDINGSIWSVPYLIMCYCIFSPIILLFNNIDRKRLNHILILVYIIGITVFSIINLAPIENLNPRINTALKFALTFQTGLLIGRFSLIKKISKPLLGLTIMLFIISKFIGDHYDAIWKYISVLPFSILIIYIGLIPNKLFSKFGKYGDPSLTIYMLGFPIQQMIISMYPNWHPLLLAAVTLSILIPLGYLSWHYFEKRIVSWNKKRQQNSIELK